MIISNGLQSAKPQSKPDMVVKLPLLLLFPLRLFFIISSFLTPKLSAMCFEKILQAMPRKPLKSAESDFLDSANQKKFDCNDTQLRGYIFGEGPKVLVVHGLLGNAANFRALILKLVANGFQVVAFDSANHGNSPDGVAFSSQPLQHLKLILGELGELHGVVSHSAGTYATMIALLDESQTCKPKKCVYMAAFPDARVTLLTFMNYFWVPKRMFVRLRELFEVIGGMPFENQTFSYCLPKQLAGGKIQMQRLFIHCRDDRHIHYSNTEEMMRGDPDAELFSTGQLGHFKILRDDAVTDKVVDFLVS